jgi:hypothetical protein
MKKLFAMTFLLITQYVLFSNNGYAQCSFSTLFPLEFGITKFDAINQLSTKNYLEEFNDPTLHKDFWNYWFKYTENDSVYQSTLLYQFSDNICLKGNTKRIDFSFTDDKLYMCFIRTEFNKNEYNKCVENYKSLMEVLKSKFQYTEPIYWENNNGEKTGEGMLLAKTPVTFENSNHQNILATISYKIDTDFSTGNPKGYYITIKYENNLGTIYER